MSLYYESHITIEPVFGERLDKFKEICKLFGFHVADLLLKKRKDDIPSRSSYDSFATGRDKDYNNILMNTLNIVDLLEENGFKVWRYKIEDTLLDSHMDDSPRRLTNRLCEISV